MLRFYTCRICGNLIEMIEDTGVIPNCCGDNMDELLPCSTDGATEKHVPIYIEICDTSNHDKQQHNNPDRDNKSQDISSDCEKQKFDKSDCNKPDCDQENSKMNHSCTKMITVKVGDQPHPMNANHAITWITVCTDKGIYRKKLDYIQKPEAVFCLNKDEQIEAIYAYCNLHGLWLNTIKK